MKIPALFVLLLALAAPLPAQTIDDGIMMTGHSLQAGNIYTRDSWDESWEGTLKRTNGNIGTITTQTDTWSAVYGLSDRLTVLGSVPQVWTRPSMGVLQGQSGMQDMTLGAKLSVFDRASTRFGMLRAIAAVSGSFPMSHYTPDFAPLSLGTHSRRISPRATVKYQSNPGWNFTASTSYTRRADVTLDRPYYFTDNQFFLTDQVSMPSIVDYVVSAGYLNHDLNANLSYSKQTTQGGGDIRRQDMPFVSNRVNVSRLSAMAMYPIPKLNRVAFLFSVAHVLDGRNVGQSTTITTGVLYSHAAKGSMIR